MNINSNINTGSFKKATGVISQPKSLDNRINELKTQIDEIDVKLSKSSDEQSNYKELYDKVLTVRGQLNRSWKRYGALALAGAVAGVMLGGGIPTMLAIGVTVGSVLKGGSDYYKVKEADDRIRFMGDQMQFTAGLGGLGNSILKSEKEKLENELSRVQDKKENAEKAVKDMAKATQKDDGAEADKSGRIEDRGHTVNINGVVLDKKAR